MKAKNLYCLLALGAGSFAFAPNAAAQDVVEEESVAVTEFSCDNTNRYFQSWRNNWFIQLGAGINQPFVERGINGGKASGPIVNHHSMTTVYNFGVGHWFSPYVGLRLNAIGGSLHWRNPNGELSDARGHATAKHANLNLEFMWDMCNSIAGVNPDRVVSVVPFVGLGGDYTWGLKDNVGTTITQNSGKIRNSTWSLPVTAGFQLRFRLCKAVDFFAEARASFYGDNWNGVAVGRPIESNVAAIGGFDININGRTWDSYNECQSMSQIAQLNNEVNTLRAENLAAAQTIAALQSQLPCPEVQVIEQDCPDIPLLSTVRFKINSDVILPTEEVNIYNMAQWLKANPDQKIVICGYADKDTGTSAYNLELSKKRADKVYNVLTTKYGVSPSRLVVKYDGSNVQPYTTNDWNRIVIFSTK